MGEVSASPNAGLLQGTADVPATAAASSSVPAPYNVASGLFANPYGEAFYETVTKDPSSGVSTINIISALDTLYLTQDDPDNLPPGSVYLPRDQNVMIWADGVMVGGKLSMPGRSLTIWARTLSVNGGSGIARIDVSGGDPVSPPAAMPKAGRADPGTAGKWEIQSWSDGGPGSAGKPGANGNTAADSNDGTAFTPVTGANAGTITINAETVSGESGVVLELFAKGGAGQNGQEAQAGQDGGYGGDGHAADGIEAMAIPPPTYSSAGGAGGAGGGGGVGGAGAAGGKGGSIVIATLNGSSGITVHCSADGGSGGQGGRGGQGGDGGSAGANGDGGRTVDGGAAGQGQKGGHGGVGGSAGTIQWYGLTPTTSVAPGAGGQPGNPGRPGTAGHHGARATGGAILEQSADGTTGTASPLGYYDASTFAKHSSALQCSMMLQKADLHYLSADPASGSGLDTAAAIYKWLQQVARPVDASVANPSSDFSDRDESLLSDVYSQACASAIRLVLLRLDYFGHLFSYVPRVAYSSQQEQLEQMISDFAALETQYKTYFDVSQSMQSKYDQIADQINAGVALADKTNQQITELHDATQELVETLDRQRSELDAAEAVMDDKIAIYSGELEGAAEGLGCSGASLDIMKLVCRTFTGAVTGDAPKLAADLADQVMDATLQKQLTDAGTTVGNASDIISKVQVLLLDIKKLSAAYDSDKRGIDDGTSKILADDESTLLNLIEPYTKMPENADGKSALDAIHQFLDVVQQRNQNVMLYNSNLARYVSLDATLATLRAQSSNATSLKADADAGLPCIVAFMGGLYHAARNAILHQLYLTTRALCYWSLSPSESALQMFVHVSDPAAITSGTLSAAHTSLQSSFNTARESFGTGTVSSFPAPGNAEGLTVSFPAEEYPAVIAALRSKTTVTNSGGYIHTVSVRLPVVTAETAATESPFANWANVRISTARPWIIGATTTGGRLSVNITHNGAEAFASNKSKQVCWFTHDPIKAVFEYDIKNKKILRDANGFGPGNDATPEYYSTADYAPPGPFAMWTITIDPEQNPGVDLSNITSIDIEFWGFGFAFS